MAVTCQWVDKIDASPTVRLDLNAAPWSLMLEGTDFGYPEMQRAVVSTLLQDGAQFPASAYGPRTLTLRFLIDSTSADNAATQLQTFHRELNRATNILKFAPNTTAPVFFRTYRTSPENVQTIRDGSDLIVVVSVLAEPFAYGLKETLTAVTVNNDPAHATNPCRFDVSSPKGDVETPLFLVVTASDVVATSRRQSAIAVRRRGTVGSTPFLLQAESMTQGTDTTTQANDAAMSGSGNNFSRTTFGTAAMTTRLTLQHPSSASVDARGTYRVFGRFRKSVSGDTIKVRLRVAENGLTVTNDTVTLPSGTSIRYADLGLVQIPMGPDPVNDGFGDEVSANGATLVLQAERTSGTGNLDTDLLLLVPADDKFALVKWSGTSGATDFVADPFRSMVYARAASGEIRTHELAELVGGLPYVTPNLTNRVFFVKDVGTTASGGDVVTGTTSVTPHYWPRYLYVRPSAT